MGDFAAGPVGALNCVHAVLPGMRERKRGTIIFTGATASMRGAPKFASFSAQKMALRGMAQSLAKEMAPEGIHVAHVVVDGMVDMELIRNFMPDVGEGRLIETAAAAETYWHLHTQPQRCFSFEVDIRPHQAEW